jgi:hypothetical protein
LGQWVEIIPITAPARDSSGVVYTAWMPVARYVVQVRAASHPRAAGDVRDDDARPRAKRHTTGALRLRAYPGPEARRLRAEPAVPEQLQLSAHDVELLDARIGDVSVGGDTPPSSALDDASQILDRLHAVSTQVLGAGDVQAMYERALDAALEILRADSRSSAATRGSRAARCRPVR